MEKIDPSNCPGGPRKGHQGGEYNNIGFSPCGEYVAHLSNKPCNVINEIPANNGLINKEDCYCRTAYCPCGEFLSHKVSEPCTAKP